MRSIIYILGWILLVLAVLMLLPIATSAIYEETEGIAFMVVALCSAAAGIALIRTRPEKINFYAKEGLACTALGWIMLSLIGAIPLTLSGEIPSYLDAVFETVSGFTTTGASILRNVEQMSRTTNMWRCFTHWIGGMGILVFLLAVLPMVGGSNMQLMKAESPGPSVGKLVPKVRFTAQLLYGLYVALTVLMIVLLIAGRMSLYDAICTACGTAGTGGFGIYNDSCASFSPYLQWVITIFMILFGVNFNVYYLIFLRKFRDALRCEEMHWYLGIILTAGFLIFRNLAGRFETVEQGLRTVFFQVATIITTTGFSTVDFNVWPTFSKIIIILLMFIGACAGSTGGGTKVSRIAIIGKSFYSYIYSFLHPRSVRRVKFEGKEVEVETLRAIYVYYTGVFLIVSISVLLVAMDGFDFETSFSAVAATFNNIGPGFGAAGPAANYADFSALSKCVMIFDMLAGRLEVFPVILLLYPRFWQEIGMEIYVRRKRNGRGYLDRRNTRGSR